MNVLDYPYLVVSLWLLVGALLLVLVLPRRRRLLLVGGVLALPSALLSSRFIPEYWDPKVVGYWICSPEDLIFSWSVGVIVLGPSLFLFRGRVRGTVRWPTTLRRFGLCFLVWLGANEALLLVVLEDHQVMHAAMFATAAVAVLLAGLRADTIPVALYSAAVFSALYLAVALAGFSMFPSAEAFWTPRAQLPFEVLGVPAFELAWAFGWGLTWPPMIWYAADLRLAPAHRATTA